MATISKSRYLGCFLGLAIGDAYGAPFEGKLLERLLWRAIGKTKDDKLRFTDDTQMSIDLARSLLGHGKVCQQDLAKCFAESYQWSRGYGPRTGRMLKKIRRGAKWSEVNRNPFSSGSLGNGAAMRAPILALCYPDNGGELKQQVALASEVTHSHPLAIEGAQMVAWTTSAVLNGFSSNGIVERLREEHTSEEYQEKLHTCGVLLRSNEKVEVKNIRKKLGNRITATGSCVTAIFYALKYRDSSFDDMLEQIIKLGGDVDTIAAMAGAIWGAANGSDAFTSKKSSIEDASTIEVLAENLYDLMCIRRDKLGAY